MEWSVAHLSVCLHTLFYGTLCNIYLFNKRYIDGIHIAGCYPTEGGGSQEVVVHLTFLSPS